MSSISFRRPEFRLYLGYPDIVLTRAGRTLGTVGTEAPDLRAALARLADAVRRARGRLVVVLPEDEVWRGRLDLAGRDRAARRASARTIVAGRLGASPDAVTVGLGARDAHGSFPVAGVRRATLSETRSLLVAVGFRAAAIVGAGAFAGFPAPPRLDGPSWRLPALPQHRRGAAAALGAGAMAALALVVLGQPSAPPTAPAAPEPAAVVAEAAPLPIRTPLPAAAPRQATPEPVGLRFAERPRPRPVAVGPQPMVTVAARNMPDDLLREIKTPPRGAVPQLLRLAERTTARARTIEEAMSAPLRRPAGQPDPEIARVAMPVLPAPAVTPELRPMRRPEAAVPAAAAKPAAKPAPKPAAESAALAPRPRARQEASQAAVLVASLDPAPFVEASVAAAAAAAVTAAPPPARPAERPVAKPAVAKAKPVAAKPATAVARAAPVVVRPKPVSVQPMVQQVAPQRQVVVRQASAASRPKVVTMAALVQPKPALQAAPVRQKVVAKPAPVRQKVVAKPAPVRKAAKPAAQKPAKVAQKPVKAKPATQRVGLKRGNVSLVGVFAGADGRRALVRLPNGNIERVKAGDRIQGVQVAAINADSVRLTGRGKDTLLRLPD